MAPDAPDATGRHGSSRPRRAATRLRSPRLLVLHAGIYLVVNGFFLVVWLLARDPPPTRPTAPSGSDYVLEDRGAHTLRGMAGVWQLFAVRA